MKAQKLRTPQEVRAEWLRKGMGQNDWARKHGFNNTSVSQVLMGGIQDLEGSATR
mgnify:CR=1 FL=1